MVTRSIGSESIVLGSSSYDFTKFLLRARANMLVKVGGMVHNGTCDNDRAKHGGVPVRCFSPLKQGCFNKQKVRRARRKKFARDGRTKYSWVEKNNGESGTLSFKSLVTNACLSSHFLTNTVLVKNNNYDNIRLIFLWPKNVHSCVKSAK